MSNVVTSSGEEGVRMVKTFYTEDELKMLGLKKYGKNVLISRNAILYAAEFLEIGDNVRIDDFVTISGKVQLGNYIHISQFCSLYGGHAGIVMSNYTTLASRTAVYAVSNDYSGGSMTNPMIPERYRPGDKDEQVILRRHVIVGCMTVILPGVIIGEGASVGAMSLVTKSLDSWGVYAGIPAKKVKDRSKKLLELEKEFAAEQV